MNYQAVVQRLFGRIPSVVVTVDLAEGLTAAALDVGREALDTVGDTPRAIAQLTSGQFVTIGTTHAFRHGDGVAELAQLPEGDVADDAGEPASVREITPAEKKFVKQHIAHGRKTYRFGKFKPGQRVKWKDETWVVYDARWRGPGKFELMLISTDYQRMASNVIPSEIGEEQTEALDGGKETMRESFDVELVRVDSFKDFLTAAAVWRGVNNQTMPGADSAFRRVWLGEFGALTENVNDRLPFGLRWEEKKADGKTIGKTTQFATAKMRDRFIEELKKRPAFVRVVTTSDPDSPSGFKESGSPHWSLFALQLDEDVQFVDRYSALGIPRPDPMTMCQGPCEGVGLVPVRSGDDDPELRRRWEEAEEKNPADDGWHFVVCPSCEGTRLREGVVAEEGYWRTTKSGHKIFIDGGKITKGNPHVVKASSGSSDSPKSDVPAGWHEANGMKEHPVPKKGKPIGWKATPDSPPVVGYASKGKQVYALVKQSDGKIGTLTAGRVKEGVDDLDEAKPFKLSTKDPATMTPAEINREKDKLSVASSELTDKFIEMGRGHWRQSDIRAEAAKGDELSKQSVAITDRQQDLTVEIELRYGPNAPTRLPLRKGFGPRKKAEESVAEAQITVKVTAKTGETWTTRINGTLDTAKRYFVGKQFNIGSDGNDKMVTVTKVELVENVEEAKANVAGWAITVGADKASIRSPDGDFYTADVDYMSGDVEVLDSDGEPASVPTAVLRAVQRLAMVAAESLDEAFDKPGITRISQFGYAISCIRRAPRIDYWWSGKTWTQNEDDARVFETRQDAQRELDQAGSEWTRNYESIDEAAPKKFDGFGTLQSRLEQAAKQKAGTGKAKITPEIHAWATKKFAGKGSASITSLQHSIDNQKIEISVKSGSVGTRTITVKPFGDYIHVTDDKGTGWANNRGTEQFFTIGESIDEALSKSDRAVILAFIARKSADGAKLSTDGTTLDGMWMGGREIAKWQGDHIYLNDLGSKAALAVHKVIRQEAPKNWIIESSKKADVEAAWRRQGVTKGRPIDPNEYPAIKGLEGPFYTRRGLVVYYDPKEGRYYDSKSDVYLDKDFNLTDSISDQGDEPLAEARTNAAGGVVVNARGRILLRKPSGEHAGYVWTFPKGTVDQGETTKEAALREVEEESGFRCKIIGRLGRYDSGMSITTMFLMVPVAKSVDPDWETESVAWVKPDRAVQMLAKTKNQRGKERDFAILRDAVRLLSDASGVTNAESVASQIKAMLAKVDQDPDAFFGAGVDEVDEGVYNANDPSPFDTPEVAKAKQAARDADMKEKKRAADAARGPAEKLAGSLTSDERRVLGVTTAYIPSARRKYAKISKEAYDAAVASLKSKGLLTSQGALSPSTRDTLRALDMNVRKELFGESVDEAAYGSGVEVTPYPVRGSKEKMWLVRKDGTLLGYVTKFNDTRTDTNPWKAFRYKNPTKADAPENPDAEFLGTTYRGKLKGAVAAVVSGQKLVQDTPESVEETKVTMSGATYTLVRKNSDGTITVRNDNGDEFDSSPGEAYAISGADAPVDNLDPRKMSKAAYVAASRELLQAKRKATLDAVVKKAGGMQAVQALMTAKRLSASQRQLRTEYSVAKRNADQDYRNDERMWSAVWDRMNKAGESVDEAKSVPSLDSPVYREATKLRGYNVKVTPLSAHGSDGGKLLAQRLSGWTKADHAAAAATHAKMAAEMEKGWAEAADAAAMKTWGRKFQMTDYRISGIGSDEFDQEMKEKLRHFAQSGSAHKDAANAHKMAMRMRSLAKEDLDEAAPVTLFTHDSAEPVIAKLQSSVKAAFVSVKKAPLWSVGNPVIHVVLSLDPKESWVNNIFHNSDYAMFSIGADGAMEVFSRSHTVAKFRKSRAKSVDDVAKRINDWIAKAKLKESAHVIDVLESFIIPANGTHSFPDRDKPVNYGEQPPMVEVPALKLAKATIFMPGGFGAWIKILVNDLTVWKQPYAQYPDALHVSFRAKGKRKEMRHAFGYKPRLVVYSGWNVDLEPESMFGEPTDTPSGASVSVGRRRSFDSGWDTAMAELVKNHKTKPVMSVIESAYEDEWDVLTGGEDLEELLAESEGKVMATPKEGDISLEVQGNEVRIWRFLTDNKARQIARSATFMGTRVIHWDDPNYAPEEKREEGKQRGLTHLVPSTEAKDFTVARLWGGKRSKGQTETLLKKYLGHLLGSNTQAHLYYSGHGFSGTSWGKVSHFTVFADPARVVESDENDAIQEGYQHVHFRDSKSVRAKVTMAGGKAKSVQGRTFDGVLMVHPTGNYQWGVTHIPTGLGLVPPPGFYDDREAVKFAKAASALGGWDFADQSAMPADLPAKMKNLISAFRPHIRSLMGGPSAAESVDEAKGAKLVAFLDMGENKNPRYAAVMDFGEHGIATYPVHGDTYQPKGKGFVVWDAVKTGKPTGGKDVTQWFRAKDHRGDVEWFEQVKRDLASASRHARSYGESIDESFAKGTKVVLQDGNGKWSIDGIATGRSDARGIEVTIYPPRGSGGTMRTAYVNPKGVKIAESLGEWMRATKPFGDGQRIIRVWRTDGTVAEQFFGVSGWNSLGSVKAELLADPAKLREAMESTRQKLEASGWSIETFAPPQ